MNSKFLAEAARGTASRAEIGGKAANLAALEKAGLPVPDWVVISSKTLAEFSAGDPGESFSFPFDFLNEIANVLPGVESFAVRSSAAIEDGATDSYAGIFESVLEVTRAKLPEALLHVWRSGFSPRVKEYRQARGLGEIEMKIAVIIQALFPAEVAGVAFGINPLTGKADERVIEAVAGLGEGLVSGKLDSDQFIVRGAIVERRLRQPAGSTTLSDGELLEISGRLDSLARHFGVPQDIEFARAGGKIMYLQSRPITAITRHEETVWENNNLIESYPGMTTPLTFDFVKKTYEIGYRQVSAMIGLPRSTIEENSARYAGMIGLLRNRMYYNLTNILAITRTVPGSNVLERSFTSAIGITDESPKKPKGLSDLTALLRFLFRTALRLFTLWLRLPSMRRKFVTDLDRILTDARKEPLATRSFDEVVNYFRELERTVFGIWRAPPLNGLFTMVFFRGLEVLTRRLRLDIDRPNRLFGSRRSPKTFAATPRPANSSRAKPRTASGLDFRTQRTRVCAPKSTITSNGTETGASAASSSLKRLPIPRPLRFLFASFSRISLKMCDSPSIRDETARSGRPRNASSNFDFPVGPSHDSSIAAGSARHARWSSGAKTFASNEVRPSGS
jgi:hypothetical protein